ncbi:MAG: PEGA domain-containing protein [Endomicrobium sp.]|nr:PEGA domain-containing protein [Endomicrobium sp.]
MFNGTKQNVSIKSMTEGSEIYVDGNYVGRDIISVALTRRDNHSVIIRKEGYKTESIGIRSSVQSGWVIFDIFVNQFALLIDLITGAWYGLDMSNIMVDLESKK